jgi:hypothetical protein
MLSDATDMALAIVEKSSKTLVYQRQRLVAAVMVVPALAFLPRTVYARPPLHREAVCSYAMPCRSNAPCSAAVRSFARHCGLGTASWC